jgi:diketogulonate reductase-like aldo/keto reductase
MAQASRLARDLTLAGPSSTTIPKLVYGTAWKKEQTADLVYTALKAGFRGIDTAAQPKHYDELGVATGVKRAVTEGIIKRGDLFVRYRQKGRLMNDIKLTLLLLASNEIHRASWSKPHHAV